MGERNVTYNSDLLKGTGLIQETIQLIDYYEPGISKQEFTAKVIDYNTLGKAHENRIKDIVHHVFYKRYLKEGEETVLELQTLRSKFVSLEQLSHILLMLTAKANPILFDFIVEVFHKEIKKGEQNLPNKAALDFIELAIKEGRIERNWAKSTKQKVSEHINACLIDFKLIDRNKQILPQYIDDFVFNYWLHKLHFSGVTDNNLMAHPDWQLWGIEPQEWLQIVNRLSYKGFFVFQYSGELTHITWNYKSVKEFINESIGQ